VSSDGDDRAEDERMSDDRRLSLVLDCLDPSTLAPFWAATLGYDVIADVGNYVMLLPADKAGPKLLIQRVPEQKTVKNRVHFDVETADIEATATELEGLGATRVSAVLSEHGSSWIVMNDPEGNEFCVCDAGAGSS
jgi:predicted enzyme related to lactoylglutathione lyase